MSTMSHPSSGPHHNKKGECSKTASQYHQPNKLNRVADRITQLEAEATGLKRETDELRMQLAKEVAETAALREMLRLANPGGRDAC